MRVLALSNLYPPNAVGGYEILCHEVMQALAERGHEVTVLTSSYGGKAAEYPPQRVLRDLTLPATEGNIYQPFVATASERTAIGQRNCDILQQTLTSTDPDLVFVWNLYFFDPSLLSALNGSGRRQVYLLTDNWLIASCNPAFIAAYFANRVLTSPGHLKTWVKRLRHRFFCRPSCHQAISGSAIFASRFMQQLYSEAGFTFRDETVIYHGVNSPLQVTSPSRDRARFCADGELRLLFAGRVVEIKGVHTAIEALPLIMRLLPGVQVRLTILGDDRDQPYLAKLRGRIRELGLDSAVDFAPAVPESDLPGLFARHDLYLFPSLYEPFSLTLIHALQAGIPTVASTAGGNPEIVRHRQTGMLFKCGNPVDLARQVVALAGSPQLRQTLSRQAIELAGEFTFKRMVDQVEAHLLTFYREPL